MIFLYSDEAGQERIKLRGEEYKYLVKVRRHRVGDQIAFRALKDSKTLYSYEIDTITPRELVLTLISSKEKEIKPLRFLHTGWCVVDPKTVEKALPALNEIGVGRISFIYCERSQKNFKIDEKRLQRILRSSNQQCGRSDFMEFGFYKNLGEFLQNYPDVKVFDFCENYLEEQADFEHILIGCEGGFSPKERKLLAKQEVFSLKTPLVLRSESAVLSVAAKILL